MSAVPLTPEIMVVLALLGLTMFLFVSEVFRVDHTAIIILILLGVLSYMPGLQQLVNPKLLFNGFASNAVISIIAVMIVGAGLEKSGMLYVVARWIHNSGADSEKRIIPVVSGAVGLISSFMQNVGAAALFLPVVSRISARTKIPLRRLLTPMGFCAILGGTITMVGSSPLILLNDLVAAVNVNLPQDDQLQTFGLFAVTPIGLALIGTGILYFVFLGKWVLPDTGGKETATSASSMQSYFRKLYGIDAQLFEVIVPKNNLLVGYRLGDIMDAHHIYIIGTYLNGQRIVAPVLNAQVETPCRLAVLGQREVVEDWATTFGLALLPKLEYFAEECASVNAGVAEILIPPGSSLIDRSAKDLQMRKAYGLNLLAIRRGDENLSHVETEQHTATRIGIIPFRAGDIIVVQTKWDRLSRLKKKSRFCHHNFRVSRRGVAPSKTRLGDVFLFFGSKPSTFY